MGGVFQENPNKKTSRKEKEQLKEKEKLAQIQRAKEDQYWEETDKNITKKQ